MRDITKDTRLCISLSARPTNIGTRFHNHLYEVLDLDFVYKAFTTTDIAAAIAGVRGLGIRGCSVSMPWKEDVIALVDEMTPSADAIRSVNTIVNDDGRLVAYNTDFIAIRALLDTHEVPRTSCAVLGAGGMARKPCDSRSRTAGMRSPWSPSKSTREPSALRRPVSMYVGRSDCSAHTLSGGTTLRPDTMRSQESSSVARTTSAQPVSFCSTAARYWASVGGVLVSGCRLWTSASASAASTLP